MAFVHKLQNENVGSLPLPHSALKQLGNAQHSNTPTFNYSYIDLAFTLMCQLMSEVWRFISSLIVSQKKTVTLKTSIIIIIIIIIIVLVYCHRLSSWYFSRTSGDPHRSGFNFTLQYFPYYV
jgi:hypothetical protein